MSGDKGINLGSDHLLDQIICDGLLDGLVIVASLLDGPGLPLLEPVPRDQGHDGQGTGIRNGLDLKKAGHCGLVIRGLGSGNSIRGFKSRPQ